MFEIKSAQEWTAAIFRKATKPPQECNLCWMADYCLDTWMTAAYNWQWASPSYLAELNRRGATK